MLQIVRYGTSKYVNSSQALCMNEKAVGDQPDASTTSGLRVVVSGCAPGFRVTDFQCCCCWCCCYCCCCCCCCCCCLSARSAARRKQPASRPAISVAAAGMLKSMPG
ncbi:unnamed protein product [Polarella glacialis]|uniref:Uncharacterized protein n=1 Tax=Polarella glacialis TaxID=89957 RepID=A0A813DMQ5_POLGL|nr:unnamed protein product [Polarella glacialis]